jgi:hypothetical protein
MKMLLIIASVFWLVSGVAGAWMAGDMHARTIARGPFGLVEWFNNNSVPYPGN